MTNKQRKKTGINFITPSNCGSTVIGYNLLSDIGRIAALNIMTIIFKASISPGNECAGINRNSSGLGARVGHPLHYVFKLRHISTTFIPVTHIFSSYWRLHYASFFDEVGHFREHPKHNVLKNKPFVPFRIYRKK
ncbi:MAG TPA: hypothetical protein VHS53_16245 [Mucilaginibacter sp.]|jgi:hypothetical protein|nr:hypothetical protein [Mucilaginibacter sp.]